MVSWNPWHGCIKYSEGCRNCYVFRLDKLYGRDSNFKINQDFELPVKRYKTGVYKYPSGTKFFTCYTSDFFLELADPYRARCWEIMKERSDCSFMIITKRIDLVVSRLPADWGIGYNNVSIVCTIEDQHQADYRIPIYDSLPIQHKALCLEPLLSQISMDIYDPASMNLEYIISGGESGPYEDARYCYESWVVRLHNDCRRWRIPFCFKQTGTNFVHLNGFIEHVQRHNQMYRAMELHYQDFYLHDLG